MSESTAEVTGAVLPEGIEVDEAAAYFGVTDSADFLLRVNEMNRIDGMSEFFSKTIDLVLQEEFGFDEAAQRLGCEGGEVYYLLAGPFGLITMSDPLKHYLGYEDSEGNAGPTPDLPAELFAALESLTDVFNLLRLFGLAHLIGGPSLLAHYISQYERLLTSPASNQPALLQLSAELAHSTQEAKSGSVTPIPSLGAPTTVMPTASPTISAELEDVRSEPHAQTPTNVSPATLPQQVSPPPATLPQRVSPPPATSPEQVSPPPATSPEQVSPPPATSPQLVDSVASPSVKSGSAAVSSREKETLVKVKPSAVNRESEVVSHQNATIAGEAFANQFSAAADISSPTLESSTSTTTTGEQVGQPSQTAATSQPATTISSTSPPTAAGPATTTSPRRDASAPTAAATHPSTKSQPTAVSTATSATSASPTDTIHQAEQSQQPQVQPLTPKRAPVTGQPIQPERPATGWPDHVPPQRPGTGWPESKGGGEEKSALDAVSDLVSRRPQTSQGAANVHHNIQSGKNCSRCGIGVEQNWLHCPVCNSKL